GRESQHLGGTELHTKATSFAALHDDGNTSFGHGTPTLGVMGTPESREDYGVLLSHQGVTQVTGPSEARHNPSLRAWFDVVVYGKKYRVIPTPPGPAGGSV
ncbi:MAG: hypothetical protein WA628_08155, partial [Terriglobales bacterium]